MVPVGQGRPITITTKPWDAAEFLGSEADVRRYLEAAFEDGDSALIRHALNAVTRAKVDAALEIMRRKRGEAPREGDEV